MGELGIREDGQLNKIELEILGVLIYVNVLKS